MESEGDRFVLTGVGARDAVARMGEAADVSPVLAALFDVVVAAGCNVRLASPVAMITSGSDLTAVVGRLEVVAAASSYVDVEIGSARFTVHRGEEADGARRLASLLGLGYGSGGDVVMATVTSRERQVGERVAARLLASERYHERRSHLPFVRLRDEVVAALVTALSERMGAALTEARLADVSGVPRSRITGYVAQLQQLLNADGYPCLVRCGEEVRLDQHLLMTQFALGTGDG